MKVFVLNCEIGGDFQTLGVYTSIAVALETLSRQHLEENEHIEHFAAINRQHFVIYTNMAIYTINEHIVKGANK